MNIEKLLLDALRGENFPAEIKAEILLPKGVFKLQEKFFATCRSCGSDYELHYDHKLFEEDGNFCGKSENCIP